MARPLSELVALMKGLEGVADAYVNPPTTGMQDPCIVIEQGLPSDVKFADNLKYLFKKGYTLTIIDRRPDSPIPDLVEGLPYTQYNRFFRLNGLNHFVFQIYF
jgi:hypothetical protein